MRQFKQSRAAAAGNVSSLFSINYTAACNNGLYIGKVGIDIGLPANKPSHSSLQQ